MLREGAVDLIISDFFMPEMDRLQFLSEGKKYGWGMPGVSTFVKLISVNPWLINYLVASQL